jgi:hypothetical protein
MAKDAHHKIDSHEKVCAERYENILKNQTDSASERSEMREETKRYFDKLDSSLASTIAANSQWRRELYSFFWKVVTGMIIVLGGTVVSLVVYIFRSAVSHVNLP